MHKGLIIISALAVASGCQTGDSGPTITGDELGRQVAELEHVVVGKVHCEEVKTVKAGAISDCYDDSIGTYRVFFDDDQGHFHVVNTTR